MLKAKQMPKKKQTKQTKKPAKNDGKITKKKYIKTKIIGGQMIQMLTLKTLNEKLIYLKDCLVNTTTATDNLNDKFKHLKITDDSVSYDSDLLKEKSYEYTEKEKTEFDNCLKWILLCLYDHDEYDSYALLDKAFKEFNVMRQEKIPEKFKTVVISTEKEQKLLTKSDLYFSKYKNFLNNFINNIISDANSNGEQGGVVQEEKVDPGQKIFESSMFDIYSKGIVLLNIDGTEDAGNHTLQVFNIVGNVNNTYNIKKEDIISFFNTNNEVLIIRRYNNNNKTDYYELECRIQLMYKLVNILIGNIEEYKNAIQKQLDTSLKDPEFLQNYKKNLLDKLIVIIFETFKAKAEAAEAAKVKAKAAKVEAEVAKVGADAAKAEEKEAIENYKRVESAYADSELKEHIIKPDIDKLENVRENVVNKNKDAFEAEIAASKAEDVKKINEKNETWLGFILRHGIILQSLKVIAYNNEIDGLFIENKYKEIFKEFHPNREDDIEEIVKEASQKGIPKYGISNMPSCPNRKDFFQHIINVIYDPKSKEDEQPNIDTLIKLSTSYASGYLPADKDCKITIDKIIKEKGYLISEAYILGEELIRSNSHIKLTSGINGQLLKDYHINMNDILKKIQDGDVKSTKKKILSDFENVKKNLKLRFNQDVFTLNKIDLNW